MKIDRLNIIFVNHVCSISDRSIYEHKIMFLDKENQKYHKRRKTKPYVGHTYP